MGKGKIGVLLLSAALAAACQRPTPTPIYIEKNPHATATPSMVPSPTPSATATPRVVPSPTPSLIPTPTPTAALGRSCAAPPIPGPQSPFTTRAAEGCLHLHLNAGGEWAHDGYEIAAMIGYLEQPPCAAFGLSISWKLTAGDSEGIRWIVNVHGAETVWKGPEGRGNVGCAYLTLRNTGAGPVDLDVRVVVDVP